ncbi:MAG: tRNA (guanosine(37)-N1)-methyltransferase TrmD [Candidatus Pacebacteria bacterium]|nr:tRNA (guanosine(37)-N1)-methyltransferase TrmD [Candidatus Paceibacterota bacterium]
MRFDIITLFPEAFSYLQTSIIKKAQEKGIIKIKFWNPRDFTFDKHKTVDDRPYSGGPGMVIKFEPVYLALEKAKKEYRTKKRKIILTSPAGKIFNQNLAQKLSQEKQIIIICGHYEGIDARIEKFVDLKISLGKFMLSGGEIPAMAIVDAVSRFLPGVLHNPLSQEEKRFGKLYSLPVYTRPSEVKVKNKILKVPKVLLSGNHKLIQKWREKHLKKII